MKMKCSVMTSFSNSCLLIIIGFTLLFASCRKEQTNHDQFALTDESIIEMMLTDPDFQAFAKSLHAFNLDIKEKRVVVEPATLADIMRQAQRMDPSENLFSKIEALEFEGNDIFVSYIKSIKIHHRAFLNNHPEIKEMDLYRLAKLQVEALEQLANYK